MTGDANLRARASALLDVLDHRGPKDRTAAVCDRARRYRASVAGGRFPALELAWAWADNLDARAAVDGHRSALGAVASWWSAQSERPPGTLVLAGRTGPGKTVAAVWLATHRGGEFVTAAALGELTFAAEASLQDLIATPLLVIDDLGDETELGPTPTRIRRLLKERHSHERTTLITTNLPEPHFAARYGDHVRDRVRTGGGFVHLRGGSRRRTGAAPVLRGIVEACRVADLVDAVEAMTGLRGRDPDSTSLDALQAAFEIDDAELGRARRRREQWSQAIRQGRAG